MGPAHHRSLRLRDLRSIFKELLRDPSALPDSEDSEIHTDPETFPKVYVAIRCDPVSNFPRMREVDDKVPFWAANQA